MYLMRSSFNATAYYRIVLRSAQTINGIRQKMGTISKFILNIFFLTAVDFVQSDGTCQNYYNQQGVCVPLDACPSLSRLNSDPTKSFYDQMIIDRSYCKGSYNDKVCCTDGRTKGSTVLPKVTRGSTKPTNHSNKKRDLLPVPGSDECGLQAADKIVGGNITAINEYPWLASLEYTWGKNENKFKNDIFMNRTLFSQRMVIKVSVVVAF